jgi:hypothetical protein
MSYIIDLMRSKHELQEDKKTLDGNEISNYISNVMEVVKDNLKSDNQSEDETSSSSEKINLNVSNKNKTKFIFTEMIKLHFKLIHFMNKATVTNISNDEEEGDLQGKLTKLNGTWMKIIEKYEINNLKEKLSEINFNI